ncbi:hypothetical protein [Comamonas testosteroni]|nr:hypothetical protein [Comamonas testosteroni]
MRKAMLAMYCVVAAFAGATTAGEIYPRHLQEEGRHIPRAEVLADLEMWNRAGMDRYRTEESYTNMTQNTEYQKSLREYRRLRSGPEFQTAVQNLKSKIGYE